jgi:outer membrane protein assembly factor BamE (lipoprotein component of BamABCDE complex)
VKKAALAGLVPSLALLAAACVSPWMGRNLPQGTSMAEVEATMGKPKETLVDSAGHTVWFYPTAPEGRDTWAARFMPDGRLVNVEQRLTKENIARVVPGTTTQKQVQEIFGSPYKAYPLPRLPFEEWDYLVLVDNRKFDYLVRFSADGIVREAYLLHDPIYDMFQRGN